MSWACRVTGKVKHEQSGITLSTDGYCVANQTASGAHIACPGLIISIIASQTGSMACPIGRKEVAWLATQTTQVGYSVAGKAGVQA